MEPEGGHRVDRIAVLGLAQQTVHRVEKGGRADVARLVAVEDAVADPSVGVDVGVLDLGQEAHTGRKCLVLLVGVDM